MLESRMTHSHTRAERAIDPGSDPGPVSLRVEYSVPIGRAVHPIKPFLQPVSLLDKQNSPSSLGHHSNTQHKVRWCEQCQRPTAHSTDRASPTQRKWEPMHQNACSAASTDSIITYRECAGNPVMTQEARQSLAPPHLDPADREGASCLHR